MLADEPTGNLDEDTRDETIGLLAKLWRERGLTLVLVSHDTGIARRAQCAGVMEKGRSLSAGIPGGSARRDGDGVRAEVASRRGTFPLRTKAMPGSRSPERNKRYTSGRHRGVRIKHWAVPRRFKQHAVDTWLYRRQTRRSGRAGRTDRAFATRLPWSKRRPRRDLTSCVCFCRCLSEAASRATQIRHDPSRSPQQIAVRKLSHGQQPLPRNGRHCSASICWGVARLAFHLGAEKSRLHSSMDPGLLDGSPCFARLNFAPVGEHTAVSRTAVSVVLSSFSR